MKIIICGAMDLLAGIFWNICHDNEVIAIYNKRKPINKFIKKAEWVKVDLCNPNSIKNYLPNTDLLLQFVATTSGAKDILQRLYIHVTDNAVMNSLRDLLSKSKDFIFLVVQ